MISCQGNTVERAQTVKNKDKEKISVITLPQSPSAEGYEWLLEPDDSVCYMPDYFPVFSCGSLNHYVQNKIKDVHLATGYVTVSFVVSETGSVGQVTIVKSAGEGAQKERVADAKTAERMDSIAYEVSKICRISLPRNGKGKLSSSGFMSSFDFKNENPNKYGTTLFAKYIRKNLSCIL